MIVVKLEDKGFFITGEKPHKVFSFWFMLLFYFGFSLNALNLYWACVQNNPATGFAAYFCLAWLLVVKMKINKINNRVKIYNILSREYDIYEVSK